MTAMRRSRHVLLSVALLCAGCDDNKPAVPAEQAPPPTPSPSALSIDAGVLGDFLAPPAPAGDLKPELDRFVNVDQCVAERAKLDPLVGDALG